MHERHRWRWPVPLEEADVLEWWLGPAQRPVLGGLLSIRLIHGALATLGSELGVQCDYEETMCQAIGVELRALDEWPALADSLYALDLQRWLADLLLDGQFGPVAWRMGMSFWAPEYEPSQEAISECLRRIEQMRWAGRHV